MGGIFLLDDQHFSTHSIVEGVAGSKSSFHSTIISCLLVGQMNASKCLSADVMFMTLTLSGLCVTGHLIPKMCVGVWLPWIMKDVMCMCVFMHVLLVRTFACSLTSPHIYDLTLSHVPFKDNLSPTHVLLSASWHRYNPTPLFSSFSTSIFFSPPLFQGL